MKEVPDLDISCLSPGCGNVALIRGNCSYHYEKLAVSVREGKATWAEYEQQGLSLPPKKKQSPFNNRS